jgi:hypothetical protein
MKTEEANQQIQELEKLQRQTRHMRLVTVLALLAIVVAGVSVIINSAYSLILAGPRQDVFVRVLSDNMKRDLLPVAQKIASQSAGHLKPVVDLELQKINARAPEVANVALRELNHIADELPAHADKVLDLTISDTMLKREAKLRQMYPDTSGEHVDLLLNNLALEIEDQLAHSGERVFDPHLNSIQNILTSLDKIHKSEPVANDRDIDPWQVTFMFMDVFVSEFKDIAPSATAQPKAAASKAAEQTNATTTPSNQ